MSELPILALAAALHSHKLKTESENFTFTLCVWWCLEKVAREDTCLEEIQPFYDYLLQSLRFSRMNTVFLRTVVNNCSLICRSRHYSFITQKFLLKVLLWTLGPLITQIRALPMVLVLITISLQLCNSARWRLSP